MAFCSMNAPYHSNSVRTASERCSKRKFGVLGRSNVNKNASFEWCIRSNCYLNDNLNAVGKCIRIFSERCPNDRLEHLFERRFYVYNFQYEILLYTLYKVNIIHGTLQTTINQCTTWSVMI